MHKFSSTTESEVFDSLREAWHDDVLPDFFARARRAGSSCLHINSYVAIHVT